MPLAVALALFPAACAALLPTPGARARALAGVGLPRAAGAPRCCAAGVEETVRSAVASGDVVLFSKSWCPYCTRTKELFDQMDVPYAAVELDEREDGAAIQAELLRTTGQRTVPSVFVGGDHVGGCDDTFALHASGQLQAKLGLGGDAANGGREDGSGGSGAAMATAAGAAALKRRRVSVGLAVGSPLLASALFFAQRSNLLRVDPVALLKRMEAQSPTLPAALADGRPTVVEFYAPWCESCKEAAPYMYKLEKRYGERLNFVVLDGAELCNAELVSKFGVDGIPHLALITGTRKLAGTLVGAVPEAVLEQNFRALAADEPLPYASTNTERSSLNPQ